MQDLDIYLSIAALSGAIIVSYVFSLISIKTRIPTVLMLLLLGIGARELTKALSIDFDVPMTFLQFLGVLGLIVILLEAGLDLTLSREKLPLMKRATASAVFILLLTSAAISVVIHLVFGQDWLTSLVYAVPLAVISSTIVASSIQHLSDSKREFLTYESSISDISGILLFNFLIAGGSFNVSFVAFNLLGIVVALVASVVVSIGLVFLLAKINVNVKAFLIFAVLLLIYALGHTWQLPTLLTVLVFGLIINNWNISRFGPFHDYLRSSDVDSAARSVKNVTAESAFLIRTVFFIAFGYTIDISQLWNLHVIVVGTVIVACIVAVRFAYFLVFNRGHLAPELFFSPRGLVTIVLFYSIPASMQIPGFDEAILFYVVMLTTLIMMIGSIAVTPKHARREGKPKLVAA